MVITDAGSHGSIGAVIASCIIIAGPNGVGKITFAREFLTNAAGVIRIVNPDLIVSGL